MKKDMTPEEICENFKISLTAAEELSRMVNMATMQSRAMERHLARLSEREKKRKSANENESASNSEEMEPVK